MDFFKTIQNSIYSPEFYSKIISKSFKASLSYFLLLALALTAVNLLALVKPLFFDAPSTLQGFVTSVINCYPRDLEIKIIKGQVSINAAEPYFVSSCDLNKQTVLVFDTKTPFSAAQFDNYQAAAWVTKDAIIYKKSGIETRTYNLNKIADFKLNKTVIDSYYQMLSPFLKFIGPILAFLAFIGIYLSYTFRLLYLLLIASLIWLLGKIFKVSLEFGHSYKVVLYAITLGLILETLVNLTSFWTHFNGFTFMVSILTLAVVFINMILPKKTG